LYRKLKLTTIVIGWRPPTPLGLSLLPAFFSQDSRLISNSAASGNEFQWNSVVDNGVCTPPCLRVVRSNNIPILTSNVNKGSLITLSLIVVLLQFKPAPMYILNKDTGLNISHTQHIGTLFRTRFRGAQFTIMSLKEAPPLRARRTSSACDSEMAPASPLASAPHSAATLCYIVNFGESHSGLSCRLPPRPGFGEREAQRLRRCGISNLQVSSVYFELDPWILIAFPYRP
jgi:hypothetical protein